MHLSLTRSETGLLLACAALLLAALAGPDLAQPAHAHDFADQRVIGRIPCALDVLSNLPFALAGGLGFVLLARVPAAALDATQRCCTGLFFAGLLTTAVGSSWYHLAPDDFRLALDRGAMSLAFAGLLGLLAATRISRRSGAVLVSALTVGAPASVLVWFHTGNVLPWAIVQFGGMAVLLGVLATTRVLPGALPVRWVMVLFAYALAKLFEIGDHAVYAATGELFSGHTAKHLIAACAAWPIIAEVARRARPQNASKPAARVA